jgi:type I restriction enzyme S subunit
MSFPRYERYKDSNYGNGELPITWSEVRLKTILAQKITDGPHETPDFTEFGIPFLSVDGIQNSELVFAGCRYISEEAHWLYRKKVQPRRDDILLAKAASTGKIARVKTDIEFNIWSPLAVIRLDTSRSIPAFVEYVLQSPESQAQVEMLCTANTQKNISMDDIPLIAFALPPRDIQSAIVTFLQRETAKIDALIEEQRRLIELLKEKRQAVISHAVTKGLNPDAPMKDSGVEWLGKVPVEWEVVGLTKYLSSIVDYRGRTPTKVDDGVFLVTAKNIRSGRIDYEASQEYIAIAEYEDVMRRGVPQIGDVLFTTEAPLGQAALVDRTDVALAQRIIKFRATPDRLAAEFLLFWILGSHCQFNLEQLATGSTAQGIKGSKVVQVRLCLPPLSQQKEIASFLDVHLARLDVLLMESDNAIRFLQERRSALISAAVTGKIDVRNYTPKEAA